MKILKPIVALITFTVLAVAEPVELIFDWEPGLVVEVNSASEGNAPIHSRYVMEVSDAGEGLVVNIDDFEILDNQILSIPGIDLPDEAIEAMAQKPGFRINADGQFGGVQNASAKVEAVKESIRNSAKLGQVAVPPQLEAFMGTALSEASMDSAAGNAWSSMAGFWAGKKLEPGKWEEGVVASSVPMFPNTDLEMDVKYRLAESSPCSEGYPGEGCVLLEKVTTPKEGSLKELMKEFLGPAMGGGEFKLDAIKEFTVENSSKLITDPANLKPQRLEMTTTFKIVMHMGGVDLPVLEQVEKQTVRYTYP